MVEWQPTKAMRLAALLGALVVVRFAVNALTILADGHLRQDTSTVRSCSAIAASGQIGWLATTILLASPRLSRQRVPTRRHIFASDRRTLAIA